MRILTDSAVTWPMITPCWRRTSPELVSDISETGITLTGGCAQLWGMVELILERTGIPTVLADDPDSCTAYGCGKSLAVRINQNIGVAQVNAQVVGKQKHIYTYSSFRAAATTAQCTSFAPAVSSIRAHSPAVEPVVRISSSRRTRFPATASLSRIW